MTTIMVPVSEKPIGDGATFCIDESGCRYIALDNNRGEFCVDPNMVRLTNQWWSLDAYCRRNLANAPAATRAYARANGLGLLPAPIEFPWLYEELEEESYYKPYIRLTLGDVWLGKHTAPEETFKSTVDLVWGKGIPAHGWYDFGIVGTNCLPSKFFVIEALRRSLLLGLPITKNPYDYFVEERR